MGGMNPEVMQQMMQSPMMQQVLNNPQFMTSVLQNNPAVREVSAGGPWYVAIQHAWPCC